MSTWIFAQEIVGSKFILIFFSFMFVFFPYSTLFYKFHKSNLRCLHPSHSHSPTLHLRSTLAFRRQSAGHKSSHTSSHRFSQLFCIKLGSMGWKKVTKPDFRNENMGAQIWAKWGQNGPKMRFSAFFLIKNIRICQYCIW